MSLHIDIIQIIYQYCDIDTKLKLNKLYNLCLYNCKLPKNTLNIKVPTLASVNLNQIYILEYTSYNLHVVHYFRNIRHAFARNYNLQKTIFYLDNKNQWSYGYNTMYNITDY